MDIVYNPRETKLLGDAKAAGCRAISGLEMFLNQAAAQFERWTGQLAPVEVMRAVLESRLA
jgi:shikimate 5-dehydrogenase